MRGVLDIGKLKFVCVEPASGEPDTHRVYLQSESDSGFLYVKGVSTLRAMREAIAGYLSDLQGGAEKPEAMVRVEDEEVTAETA